ncbi:flagellar filament capping protein FliD [Catenovulum sp. 2E275]|uniref:flagellar filament capping protein FliD n=1 Tax=Catenovulum sp. 2E275 TaxID=2980497 RepID=UPI0021D0D0B1|nr:flagellar filament capping protein FliD [Catenovulum sp. 2E275]MCU4674763.1 flagellar filament capping protein FliD [Catenovulum sp. 2E275]
MSVSSIGVGSGLDLSGLVTQLLEAERAPKQARLDTREETLESEISAIGKLKSKLDEFKEAVRELRSSYDLQGRKALVTHPNISSDDESSTGPFTAEASNSAVKGEYRIAIEQLASGSRLQTNGAGFTSSSSAVSSTAGTMTFTAGSDTFDINVTAGMTVAQLRAAVNSAGEEYGIKASIIDTGTAEGAKLVFTSDKTGEGNDLVVTNNNAELDKVSTAGMDVTAAKNAIANIDGIAVESQTNEFENVIENVSFEAEEVSEKDALGEFKTSKLEIGYDKDGLKNKITDFVDNYNSIMDEIATLTKYGTSELEEDGPLAGDYMARSIQTGLSSIVSGSVSTSSLSTLFQIGVSFDDDGKLQISSTDDFGFGSGEDLLDDALDDNYDQIAALFSDDDEGIANKMYDFVHEYTTYGGLLRTRESAKKDEKDLLSDERERFELQMADYETLLRNKYINLDLTVSKLQRTQSSLMAALGYA